MGFTDYSAHAGEVQWLHPAIPIDLLWDDSLSSSNEASQTSILQGLLQQALTGPLLPAQQQQVLEHLQANPKRVFSCGLTPQRLPDLVELNPVIAIEVRLACCYACTSPAQRSTAWPSTAQPSPAPPVMLHCKSLRCL